MELRPFTKKTRYDHFSWSMWTFYHYFHSAALVHTKCSYRYLRSNNIMFTTLCYYYYLSYHITQCIFRLPPSCNTKKKTSLMCVRPVLISIVFFSTFHPTVLFFVIPNNIPPIFRWRSVVNTLWACSLLKQIHYYNV